MARQPDVQYIHLYTDGNAARKIAPVAPVHKAQIPKKRKQKKIIICVDPLAIMALTVAVVMMVLMAVGLTKLNQAREQTAVMEQYVNQLQNETQSLQEAYEAGYDLEHVEQTAKALGMIPAQDVEHITVQVHMPGAESEPTAWERLCVFLTGLFA
jgi:hypothetical protein